MNTTLVPIETLGAEIKARVEAGDKALDKAEQHYIAAGIQLAGTRRRRAQVALARASLGRLLPRNGHQQSRARQGPRQQHQ